MRPGIRRPLLVAAAALLVAVVPAIGSAQAGGEAVKHPRMSGGLVALEAASMARSIDTVTVEVTAVSLASSDAAAAIQAAGGQVEATYGEYAAGTVPVANLRVLGADTNVRWVQPPAVPYPEETVGEGPVFMGADGWHDRGFTGRGQVVAIIDSGFENLGGAQDSGDAPAYGDISEFGAQAMKLDLCPPEHAHGPKPFDSGTVHGTAVAEIVHETAPDADLLLICIDNSSDFGAALNFAQANGARVVSVSLGFFNTGRGDGSGSLREWANKARNKGMLWVNSNGNYAETHWHGPLTDADDDDWHDTTWSFSTASGAELFLKWDDWPSDCDLDLYVCSTADCGGASDPVAGGFDLQNGTPPTEEASLSASGNLFARVRIADSQPEVDCAGSPRLDLFVPSGPSAISPATAASSVTGIVPHPLTHSVGAIGFDGGSGGAGVVHWYSSRGPTIDGDTVPDTVAPAGVSNGQYGDGFWGTSAAAPHVAGSAALILQAYPMLTVAELDAQLKEYTSDLGEVGADNDYGVGRISFPTAPNLAQCFGRNPTLTGSDGDDYLEGTAGADVILAREGNDIVVGLDGNDRICGGGGTDTLYGDLGNDIMSGGSGRDWIWGGPNHDRMYGDGANDQLRGGSGRDRMWGGLGADKIVGNTGNDTLYGEGGDDWMDGAGGNDSLTGNRGIDFGKGGNGTDFCSVETPIDCE